MSREDALNKLQDIRLEILEIHSGMEKCRTIQRQIETLQNEKDNPAPFKIDLKEENTADNLKKSIQAENRRRAVENCKPKNILKIVNIAFQLLICLILALDLFGAKGIIIRSNMIAEIEKFGSENKIILFGSQIILSLFVSLAPLCKSFFQKKKVLFSLIFAFVLICYLFMMGSMVKAYFYIILFFGCSALMLLASRITNSIQESVIKSGSLSKKQQLMINSAKLADEKAKAENIKLRKQAENLQAEKQKLRSPQIDQEIDEKVRDFKIARENIDLHIKKLDSLDSLSDEDKTLQIVDLLIRFIQTHRADSIKEALHEYDKLMANRQLLEIEKQKLIAELKRAEQEHSDRAKQLEAQKRHQSEMEYLAWDSAQSRAKMLSQLNNIGNIIYYDLHG